MSLGFSLEKTRQSTIEEDTQHPYMASACSPERHYTCMCIYNMHTHANMYTPQEIPFVLPSTSLAHSPVKARCAQGCSSGKTSYGAIQPCSELELSPAPRREFMYDTVNMANTHGDRCHKLKKRNLFILFHCCGHVVKLPLK